MDGDSQSTGGKDHSTDPIEITFESDHVEEIEMPEECKGIKLGCEVSSLLGQQAANGMVAAGRVFDQSAGQVATQSLFNISALNGTIVKNFSELDAIESRANARILDGPPGQPQA
jgi:hypothetical protein